MSRKNFSLDLVAFTAETWLMEPEAWALLFAQVLQQGSVVFALDDEDPIHYADPNWSYYPTAKVENSTAIVDVRGVIYDYYVDYLCEKLDKLYADSNVSRMIVRIKSPGGAANAAYKLADKFNACPFPTAGFVDYGMAGSSGYLVGCALDLFYASRPNDIVGSIGTYIPYQNWDGYFEKMGIKQEDIYAKQSSEKNLEGRQAAEGNFKLLQKMADDEAARFISYVKDRRPNLNLEAGDPFKGKIFSATDALSIGLIDGIGDLKAAVTALKSSDTTQNTTPRTTMSKLFGYAKVAALTALATSVTAETIQAANEELESQLGLKDFQLISKTEFESMIEAANKAPDTKALDDKISALNTQVTNLTEERNGWKTKAEEYGAKNGDEKTTIKTQGDKPADEGESQNSADSVIAGLEHNKALEGTWFATLGQAETK